MGLIAAAVLLTASRMHAFDLPLETDEANYAYIGGRLLAGDRLYVEVWDHQPPGIFVLFAAVTHLFGDGVLVFRWLAATACLCHMWLIADLLRLTHGRWAGLLGAGLFALVSADPGTAGEGVNREIFMSLLLTAAWRVAVGSWCAPVAGCRSLPYGFNSTSPEAQPTSDAGSALLAAKAPRTAWATKERRAFLAAGALIGLASWLKTIVAVHWLALGLCQICVRPPIWGKNAKREANPGSRLTRSDTRQGSEGEEISPAPIRRATWGGEWGPAARAWLLLGLGPLFIWMATLGYFSLTGRGALFWEAVFNFNLSYSEGGGFFERFSNFFQPARHPHLFDSALPLWRVALPLGLIGWMTQHSRGPTAVFLAYLAASYLTVCLPNQFWPHYYYLMLAPLVLTSASGIAALFPTLGRRNIRGKGERALPSTAEGSFERRGSWARFILGSLAVGLLLVLSAWSQYRHYWSKRGIDITLARYNTRDYWGRALGWKVASVTEPSDYVFMYGADAGVYYYSRRRCASRFTMTLPLRPQYPGFDERRRLLMEDLGRHRPRIILAAAEPPFDAWTAFLTDGYEWIGVDRHDRDGSVILMVWQDRDRPVRPIDWNWDRSEADP